MGFSRQKYWSGLPFPSPKDLPDPGTETVSCIGSQILYHWSPLFPASSTYFGRYFTMCTKDWMECPLASCPHSRTTHLRLNQPLIPLPFSGSKPIDAKTWRQRSSPEVSTVGFRNGCDVLALWLAQGSPWLPASEWLDLPQFWSVCWFSRFLLTLTVAVQATFCCCDPNYDSCSHPKVKSKVKLLIHVWLLAPPWTAAYIRGSSIHRESLIFTVLLSVFKNKNYAYLSFLVLELSIHMAPQGDCI